MGRASLAGAARGDAPGSGGAARGRTVDLETAAATAAPAWRFAIGYTAGLRLCTVVLNASGYRASGERKHYRTILALPFALGGAAQTTAEYLETCSRKRDDVTYESVGGVSDDEADELVATVRTLRSDVASWLKREHPSLSPSEEVAGQ